MSYDLDERAAEKISYMAQKSIREKQLISDKISELIELQKSMMEPQNQSYNNECEQQNDGNRGRDTGFC